VIASLKNCLANPVRSLVVSLCLVALLTPFLTALAISEGIKKDTRALVDAGADIYVTGDQFGSNAPMPLSSLKPLADLPGVVRVVPRVIGRTYLNQYFLAVLGISPAHLPPSIHLLQGRVFHEPGEVLLGENLAALFHIKPGARFYLSRNPGQHFRVAGIFSSTFQPWKADLVVMSFEDAARLFHLPGMATDFLITCRPGYETPLAEQILQIKALHPEGSPPLRVQTKSLITSYLLKGFDTRAGILAGFYTLAFLLAVPIILLTSGLGFSGRKQEIGIAKALGWQTQEVLILAGLENVWLALFSLPWLLFFSQLWLRAGNGFLLNRFFIANWAILPPFSVPAQTFPMPFLLTLFLTLVLTLVGSLYSTWRMAVVPPHQAMHG